MRIVAAGVSHSSAPLSVLEALCIPSDELDAALSRLRAVAPESLILSTCNRTEIYAVVGNRSGDAELLLDLLTERGGLRADELRQYCYVRSHDKAVRHALRVASGLDSMVLGEDQIQAQMKRAIAAARDADMLGPTLDRLGSAALACGKRVRTFTDVGRHSGSLESVAAEAARGAIANLETQSVVILGSGSSAGRIVEHLTSAGIERLTIMSRSTGRANVLAETYDVEITPWEHLAETLVDARVVFCCTSAPHPVLTRDTLSRRIAARPGAALLCVDLGMPRDVDASVATIEGVSVVSLDDLGALARAHQSARPDHVPAAEAIVDRETARFLGWLKGRGATAEIRRLHAHADAIAEAEVNRALARLQTLSGRDRAIVTDMARRIVRKLVHEPTDALKQRANVDGAAEEAAS